MVIQVSEAHSRHTTTMIYSLLWQRINTGSGDDWIKDGIEPSHDQFYAPRNGKNNSPETRLFLLSIVKYVPL